MADDIQPPDIQPQESPMAAQAAAGALDPSQSQVPLQSAQPVLKPPTPTTGYGMPALITMIGQMIHPTATLQPGQMPRSPSRLNEFEHFLANFTSSLGAGLAASGTGPGANIRGAAGALNQPHQAALQQYQLGLQQQEAQQKMAQAQAQEELTRSQSSGVYVPGVGIMPAKLAEPLIAAQTRAGATEQSATTRAGAQIGVANIGKVKSEDIQANKAALAVKLQNLKDTSDQRVAQIRATGIRPILIATPNGPQYVTPSQALGQQGARAASPTDILKTTQNQGQIELALPRLQELHDNADVISSLLDAGKISLAIGAGGTLQASIGRGANLTDREKKFASDFQSMSEDINLLRAPLGATGFRSSEAFNALQAQRGRLAQNPQVFMGVLENTIASMQKLSDANSTFLKNYGGGGGSSSPAPSTSGRRTVDLTK